MKAVVLFALLSSIASAATAPPKVVFIGDYITYNWTASAFASNPNWVNQGVQGVGFGGLQSPPNIAAAIALHPAIIHILMGANISDVTSPASVPYIYGYAQTLDTMVKQAQAANIKVILGITPGSGNGWDGVLPQLNSIVVAYGATHDIQVVNYQDAICQCVGSLGNL